MNYTHALCLPHTTIKASPFSRYLGRHPNGHQTPLRLPSGEDGSRRHKATLSLVGSGVVNVGHWTRQPPTGLQSNDHTSGYDSTTGARAGPQVEADTLQILMATTKPTIRQAMQGE